MLSDLGFSNCHSMSFRYVTLIESIDKLLLLCVTNAFSSSLMIAAPYLEIILNKFVKS